jgi:hypothetical protein
MTATTTTTPVHWESVIIGAGMRYGGIPYAALPEGPVAEEPDPWAARLDAVRTATERLS